MSIFVFVFTVVFSYLLGSMNSAIVVCRIMQGKDIREYGSGNAGLTNVLRTFGKPTAAVTLVVDLIKGVAAVMLCRLLASQLDVVLFGNEMTVRYLAGLFVMLGHIFPCYYGFRGGKGVLLTATTALAIDPATCGVAFTVFLIVILLSRYVSLASISAAAAYPIVTFLMQLVRGYESPWMDALFTLAMSALIISRHHSNIKRLLNGTEDKLSLKSRK